jgi:hypothetical protein
MRKAAKLVAKFFDDESVNIKLFPEAFDCQNAAKSNIPHVIQ